MTIRTMTIGDSIISKRSQIISFCIFVFFGLLAFLKHNFPKTICESFIDKIQNFTYIIVFCAICTLIVTLWSRKPLKINILVDIVINFIYLVGVVFICIKIFL